MNIDYWRLFLLALGILAVVIVWRWFADARNDVIGIFPSSRNDTRYNLAAGIMCAIGVWGLLRQLRNGRSQG